MSKTDGLPLDFDAEAYHGLEPYQYSNLHMVDRLPKVQMAHYGAEPGELSRAVAVRIMAAYQHSIAIQNQHAASQADLWTDIVNVHLKRMVDCLSTGNIEELIAIISNFGMEYTWFGGITTGVDGFNHWDRNERAVAYSYFDKLVGLAEAVGVLPAENPEQGKDGNWGKNICREPDEVVRMIEAKIGISILPPLGILPVSGIKLANGALHYRHINALYTALRVRDLTTPSDAVCEYGGGIGLVALYLSRWGRSNYTLFDLPIVNVLSSYMLMMALGEDAVCLEGEKPVDNRIKVRLGKNCHLEANKKFTMALNQDSFPEIDKTIVMDYLNEIQRTTSRCFLSINHEVEQAITKSANHLNISKLLEEDDRFKRSYRMPYWLRRGYVEELYSIN